MNISDYKNELDLLYGSHTGDRLYGAYDLLFSVCAELSYRGNDYPFTHWKYSEPMNANYRDENCYFYELLQETNTETLINLGNLLSRYLDYLYYNGYEV